MKEVLPCAPATLDLPAGDRDRRVRGRHSRPAGLLLGIIEIGRLIMVAQVNTNAAREAARYAPKAPQTADRRYLRPQLPNRGRGQRAAAGSNSAVTVAVEYQSGTTWTATTDPSTLPSGTPIRVTVSANFNQQSWLPSRFFVGNNTQSRASRSCARSNPCEHSLPPPRGRAFPPSESGATAVEYAVLVAFVVLVCVAAVAAFRRRPAAPSTAAAPPSAPTPTREPAAAKNPRAL